MASKTGRASVAEALIMRSTSAVAVCCSSAVVSSVLRASSSVNSRTFSIAMTAWSANVRSRSIWRSEKAPASTRATAIAPTARPSRSMGTATMAR